MPDGATWTCACCGKEFADLPDIVFDAPVDWPNLGWLAKARSRLDSDFCRVHYSDGEIVRMIRCILPLPVPELDRQFRFGVWMSVSEDSWRIYEAGFKTGQYEKDICFSYLMHEIPDYEGSLNLECELRFQPDAKRPLVHIYEAEHPLYRAQQRGVTAAQVHAWIERVHDIGKGSG